MVTDSGMDTEIQRFGGYLIPKENW
jgi:hypothetical protein